MNIQESLLEAIRNADRMRTYALLNRWGAENGYGELYNQVVEPLLMKIGHDWSASESFSLAQVYIAAKVAEDGLTLIAEHRQAMSERVQLKGPVVIGNIEEDYHSLGRRMIVRFLQLEGWNVLDLGNDVPAGDFVDKAEETGARIIGVSAMILSNARRIREVREEINHRGMKGRVQLAVGGAVFKVVPNIMEEVGGDGTCPNALCVGELFSRLWWKSTMSEANP
jgi:methanogenic corrinoid protein MtbC1